MWNDTYSTDQNQFDRLGHPGRITSVIEYTGGQLDLTGSNYGYGAIRVVTHGSATASLSGGGAIGLSNFNNSATIFPLSVAKIHGAAADSAKIYVFKVRGTI